MDPCYKTAEKFADKICSTSDLKDFCSSFPVNKKISYQMGKEYVYLKYSMATWLCDRFVARNPDRAGEILKVKGILVNILANKLKAIYVDYGCTINEMLERHNYYMNKIDIKNPNSFCTTYINYLNFRVDPFIPYTENGLAYIFDNYKVLNIILRKYFVRAKSGNGCLTCILANLLFIFLVFSLV